MSRPILHENLPITGILMKSLLKGYLNLDLPFVNPSQLEDLRQRLE